MSESNLIQLVRPDDAQKVDGHQWGVSFHESCQYNFFCDDKFFCVRLMEIRDFLHQSAWVYDGEVHELLNAGDVIERDGDDHLKISTSRFLMESDDLRGWVTVLAESGSAALEMKWTIPIATVWGAPGDAIGMHQPLLEGEVTYKGQTYTGPGYCKRFRFYLDPEYFSWRFIEGAFDSADGMVWTADAFFGLNSYDYFKVAYADGTILSADDQHTHHRDNIAYGNIDGRTFQAEVEEIGQWQTRLLGENMETLLRQRYCKLVVRDDGREHKGYALHETGGGTMR